MIQPSRRVFLWGASIAIFLLGLALRIEALNIPPEKPLFGLGTPIEAQLASAAATRWTPKFFPLEMDELIYVALVQQVELGKGYTLQGHPILQQLWISREQYDRPLFFHPPGGIALFWLTHKVAGSAGFALAQVLSFVLFFWSVVLIGKLVVPNLGSVAMLCISILASFTPIMAHVAGRFWLDGPLLAFATAAAAVFLLSVQRSRAILAVIAGLLLGYAGLIKLTAFLIVPGLVAVAFVSPSKGKRELIRYTLVFLGVGILLQIPWAIVQWRVTGSMLPGWAGKPSIELIRRNQFVYYLTVYRSPWIYLKLLPQLVWTLSPCLVLWAMQWRDTQIRRRGAALLFWILVILAVHIAIGALGYSKLVRYVILITPAAVVLFGLVVQGAIVSVRQIAFDGSGKLFPIVMLCLAGIGLSLEVTQSLRTAFIDNRRLDVMRPLPGLKEID